MGDDELALLAEVIASGTLTATKGQQTKSLESEFADRLGVAHAIACSSGTAALHTAVAALDPEPGDEIITTPITDMGAITPILYQGAIPVFADVDPDTGNVTAATIEDRLSDRTRAVMVTHLFGNPCEMDDIVSMLAERDIPVIEDCAQAYGASTGGRPVGTIGPIGCFSLQQGKHITTGEGGLVVTDDDTLARRARVFVNKGWPYGEAGPDHEFLALNYRLTELQGAVARAQLGKLDAMLEVRARTTARFTDLIADIPGVRSPVVADGDVHGYWRYCLLVDGEVVGGGPRALAERLSVHGIASAPRYIQKPAYECKVLSEQRTFGDSRWPFTLAKPEAVDYDPARFPGVYAALDRMLVLGWNEGMTDEHVDGLAAALRTAAAEVSST
jgi:dTDP-4-amino-4,6-dideoxygalactose transaminase